MHHGVSCHCKLHIPIYGCHLDGSITFIGDRTETQDLYRLYYWHRMSLWQVKHVYSSKSVTPQHQEKL